ncbi:uncharacterized protein CLUP02_14921, partial [Colletotrichum lupini]
VCRRYLRASRLRATRSYGSRRESGERTASERKGVACCMQVGKEMDGEREIITCMPIPPWFLNPISTGTPDMPALESVALLAKSPFTFILSFSVFMPARLSFYLLTECLGLSHPIAKSCGTLQLRGGNLATDTREERRLHPSRV